MVFSGSSKVEDLQPSLRRWLRCVEVLAALSGLLVAGIVVSEQYLSKRTYLSHLWPIHRTAVFVVLPLYLASCLVLPATLVYTVATSRPTELIPSWLKRGMAFFGWLVVCGVAWVWSYFVLLL